MIKKALFFATFIALLFTVSNVTHASFGTEHVKKGSFAQGVSALKYYYDSSVGTYGYTSHFDHGIANWDVLSSKVGLSKTTSSSADIKIYVGSGNLSSGVLGSTDYWKYDLFGRITQVPVSDVTNGTNFDQARIRMDNQEIVNMGFYTWGNKVKVTAHEVGHTLGLSHFETSPAHTDKTSWMYTSKTDSQYPSTDDKNHLVYKWGQ